MSTHDFRTAPRNASGPTPDVRQGDLAPGSTPTAARSDSSRGYRTTHPRVYVEPLDRDERPRRYAPEFTEHEWAIAWTHHVTAEHHARFGMRHGCRQTPNGGTTT